MSSPTELYSMNGILRYGLAACAFGLGLTNLLGGSPGPVPVATPAVAQADPRPFVWVADGAGGYGGCSTAMTQANALAGNPVEIRAFEWTHGHGRVILDQMHLAHARDQGRRFASAILQQRACEPGRRVVVVCHSAGAAVSLAAGDALPAGSIDRMILLAPSVSRGYDVGPSLCASREGIDVFCSKKDWIALGIGARVVGTTDRFLGRAAGRHGFRAGCSDSCLLRQHFWSSEMAWTGHTGGHFGVHSPTFIQTYLMPMIGPH